MTTRATHATTRALSQGEGPLSLLDPTHASREVTWVPELVGTARPLRRRLRSYVPTVVVGLALGFAIVALVAAGYLFYRLRTTESRLQNTNVQLVRLEQRVKDTRQSIRFTHDLVILCSYDRHLCLDGLGRPSVVVANILRRAGLDPRRIPKTD